MIEILFEFGTDVILIRIKGNHITFCNTMFGAIEAPIDGIQLSKEGCIREWADLKDNPNWKQEAIKRFKEKISSFNTEEQKANYIIEDLKKFGYIPKYLKENGFRRKSLSGVYK